MQPAVWKMMDTTTSQACQLKGRTHMKMRIGSGSSWMKARGAMTV